MDYKLINRLSGQDSVYTNERIADFLVEHLEQYGDKREDVLRALDYVFNEHRGGLILLGLENNEIIGAVIINDTGMKGYIPEHILVYIATHKEHRGKGVGKALMENVIKATPGDVALHVEPDNPAVHLYRKAGFTNKYLEMRYKKTSS